MDINLLPSELKPKRYISKFAKTLRKIALISLLVVLIASIFSIVTLIFFSQRTKSSISQQQKLTQEIANLERTEKQLIFVRDRVQKVKSVFSSESAKEEVDVLEEVSKILPPGISLVDAIASPDSFEISVNAPGLLEVTALMRAITQEGQFGYVEMNSFAFLPEKGYSLSFNLKK